MEMLLWHWMDANLHDHADYDCYATDKPSGPESSLRSALTASFVARVVDKLTVESSVY